MANDVDMFFGKTTVYEFFQEGPKLTRQTVVHQAGSDKRLTFSDKLVAGLDEVIVKRRMTMSAAITLLADGTDEEVVIMPDEQQIAISKCFGPNVQLHRGGPLRQHLRLPSFGSVLWIALRFVACDEAARKSAA